MANDRRLLPFFSYFGSKWKTIRYYPAPQHSLLIEPFAGSATYATTYPDCNVKLFDVNPIVVGVWRYLIATPAAEIRRLPLLEHGQRVDELAVCQEARWLIGFWLNKSAVAPCRQLSAWARTPEWAYQFWGPARRERVAAQVDRIRHWQVFEMRHDAAPNVEATWFVDPPYQEAGRRYPHGSDSIDYARLAAWCRARRGQAIVCEHDGAAWLPFRALVTKPGVTLKRATEAVWP